MEQSFMGKKGGQNADEVLCVNGHWNGILPTLPNHLRGASLGRWRCLIWGLSEP
ncbi:hypothetical protein QUF75_06910 [Desulfococcaceae bacterium HSG7]|nr:hypothetical protein [Desulfococcaceae bacterium HSG7]